MHTAIKKLFDERRAPSHCKRDDALTTLKPMLDFVSRAQAQIGAYRAAILEAEMDPTLPDAFRGKTEHIMQGLDAAQRHVDSALKELRQAAKAFVQVDADLATSEADLERASQAIAVKPSGAAPK